MNNVTNKTKAFSTEEKKGRLPDFIIIGAAKSGTTTLHKYLCRHPQVFMSKMKEPIFFSDDSVFTRGLEWYQSLFADAKMDQICGEASTQYTLWPHTPDVPRRIAQISKDIKFIYIMRNPVERTYSHYEHLYMRAGLMVTFEEALERTDIIVASLYKQQIERYLRIFPRESFLFLLFEELIMGPDATLERVQRFLGVDVIDLIAKEKIFDNKGKADFFVRRQTTQRLRAIPGGDRIVNQIPKSWRNFINLKVIESSLGRWLKKRYRDQFVIAPTTRARLLKIFEEPNLQLAKFLERDLSHWSK